MFVLEAATLIQTRKIRHFPIVLVGTHYWSGLLTWLRDRMLGGGKIGPRDLDLFDLTDDLDHVVARVREAVAAQGVPLAGGDQ
jgi:predicted Rossmann-fold nucleotide-binding protein